MNLTTGQALLAYAKMMNPLDPSCVESLLAEDFQSASQWVFTDIKSKNKYLGHIAPKLESIKNSGAQVWAEMGWLGQYLQLPCVVMVQGDKDNLEAVVLAKVDGVKIKRMDLCGTPSPHSASRSDL